MKIAKTFIVLSAEVAELPENLLISTSSWIPIQPPLALDEKAQKNILVWPVTGSQLVDKSTNIPMFGGWNTAPTCTR